MILRRIGNKSQIAMKIQQHFPQHKIYIEPFFGAGGMFFNKPKSQYNIVNDLDSDVFNLFQVVRNNKEQLEAEFLGMPIHQDLLEYWKRNKEIDPIKKALRFLFLSNFTYLGKQDTMRSNPDNSKAILYEKLNDTHKLIFDVQFFNKDFRKFLSCLSLDSEKRILSKDTFIYADSPYIGTVSTYEMAGDWTEQDASDLFDVLTETGCKFAYSEFDHPFILEQAEKRNLNVIKIGERKNLKNNRIEILVTNYEKQKNLFD